MPNQHHHNRDLGRIASGSARIWVPGGLASVSGPAEPCLCPEWAKPHSGPCFRDEIALLIKHNGLRLRCQAETAMERYLMTGDFRYWTIAAGLAMQAAGRGVAA